MRKDFRMTRDHGRYKAGQIVSLPNNQGRILIALRRAEEYDGKVITQSPVTKELDGVNAASPKGELVQPPKPLAPPPPPPSAPSVAGTKPAEIKKGSTPKQNAKKQESGE